MCSESGSQPSVVAPGPPIQASSWAFVSTVVLPVAGSSNNTQRSLLSADLADMTAFFSLERTESGGHGVLVEYDETQKIFTQPADKRTEGYVTGRFG